MQSSHSGAHRTRGSPSPTSLANPKPYRLKPAASLAFGSANRREAQLVVKHDGVAGRTHTVVHGRRQGRPAAKTVGGAARLPLRGAPKATRHAKGGGAAQLRLAASADPGCRVSACACVALSRLCLC
jgi:hypothetical protein